MGLPGEKDRPVVPPQLIRIAIGSTYEKNGRLLPRKDDHFTCRRLSKSSGEKPTYLVDTEMQGRMCKAAGVADSPRAIPVTLIGNAGMGDDGKSPTLPESILFAEMARYSGGRRECSCGQWGTDGKGTATRKTYQRKKTSDGSREYTVLAKTDQITCDPATCPFATGTHGVPKYEGVALCKPHVIASMVLPWSEAVGTVAKLKTTGWNNYYAMRDSLLTIALQTGGWLHDIPLWLTYEWARSGDGNLVPSLRFEYRGDIEALRRDAMPKLQAWNEDVPRLKALQAGAVQSTLELVEDVADQEATAAEFYSGPQGVPATPVLDGEFEAEDGAECGVYVGEPETDCTTNAQDADGEPEQPQDAPPAPEATPVPMLFNETPVSAHEARKVFLAMGEGPAFIGCLEDAWEAECGQRRTTLPTPSTCNDPDEEQRMISHIIEACEAWWFREGYAKHQDGGDQ